MRRDEMKTLSSVKGGDEVIFPFFTKISEVLPRLVVDVAGRLVTDAVVVV